MMSETTGAFSPSISARGVSLAARAEQQLLNLAAAADSRKKANELQAIKTACTRAEELAVRLRAVREATSALASLGIEPVLTAHPDAAKARRNLRTLATAAVDPGVDVVERLRAGSVHEALKVAELTARNAENVLTEAADKERRRLRPADLDALATTVPGRESVALAIKRIRSAFEELPRTTPASVLPTKVEMWRAQAAEWERLKTVIDEVVAQMDPQIQAFVNAAATVQGAPWSMITAKVRAWLDTDGNDDEYRVRWAHG
jgi:phosphoenolpyruvate carboxylase